MRLTVSKLVGIEGDPQTWVPAKKPSVKHISAPYYGWEFKALGFSYRRQTLVWSESMNKKIQALVLNGSTETLDVFTGTSSEVNGLVVDWMSDNVYWSDALYNWVIMAPLRKYSSDRVYRIVVQDGLDNPHGLAVYPKYNWLFLSDWGLRPRIERMDLLGNKRQVIVDTDVVQPRGMVIDMAKLRLYWVDSAKETVESVYLEGVGFHRNVIKIDKGKQMFDLAVFNDYVFLTEQSQGLLKVIRQDSNEDIVSFTLGNVPYGIIMYDEDQQPGQPGECETTGCDQMCLDDPLTGPQCLCGEGYDILDDKKTCVLRKQLTHPSHMYAIGVAICMYPANIADMSLDNVSLTSQCFLSDRYGYLALTFDAENNRLYYSGNYTSTIYSIPLETGSKASVVASATGSVRGLALDWVLGVLYWTDSTYAHIKVARKDGRFQRVLLEKDVNNPLGIAVHPHRGKIYWTDIGFQPDVMPKVEMANMDGSEREIILKDNLGQPNHMFIDYNIDKLYWADSILNHIREYDLTTRALKVFYQQASVKFYGLSLYKDYLLWTDTDDMNGIHIARMDTERKVRGIIHPNYGEAADIITFDKLLQPNFTSPCRNITNGRRRCGQLCLPSGADNFTCSCGLGFYLNDDFKCSLVKHSNDNFLIVNDAYQRNMYQVDAKSGVISALSQGEEHEPIAIEFDSHPLHKILYWSDNTVHVIRRKPMEDTKAYSFLNLPEDSVVDGLALDPVNRLLFYTDTGRDQISVATLDTTPVRHAVIMRDGLDQPRDIVVSSPNAMIYWSDWGDNASISEASMNGDDRRVIVSFNRSAWPNGLAIDVKGQALYWADAHNNEIGMYHLDTGSQRILLMEPAAHYFGLFVMGDFLYVTDWKRRYVARMHKLGGELMRFGEDKFTKLYGVTGYNSSEVIIGRGTCSNQTRCSNTSICVPDAPTTFVCICIDGYIRVGPHCEIVRTTTNTTTTATTTTSNSTTTPATKNTTDIATTLPPNTTTSTITKIQNPTTANTITATTTTHIITSTRDNSLHWFTDTSNTTTTTDSDNDSGNNSGDKGGDKSGDKSSDKSGKTGEGLGPRHGGNHENRGDDETNVKTGIIVASVLVGIAVLVAVLVAAGLYYSRRSSYQVPHTRLTEDRTTMPSDSSPSASSRVTYAHHNSAESVHFDEGFENPTYDVTMAMLSAQHEEAKQPAD
ncbi:hypothetical protein V1264_009998 [Littorina saxatilis]